MRFNDARLAGKIEQIRAEQRARRDRAADPRWPVHTASDDILLVLQQRLTEANITRMQTHPDYRAVGEAMARTSLAAPATSRVLVHVKSDMARYGAAVLCLGLSADPAGLTYSRFHALMETLKLGSRTWSYALFGYLRFVRYIEPAPQADDGRERRFRPTPDLRDGLRAELADGFRAIVPMDPAARGLGEQLEADDAVFDQVARFCSDALVAGFLVHAVSEEETLSVLSKRRMGLPMLWTLVLAAPEGEEWPTAETFPVSIADLARRSGVSRAHFTRMLRDGEAAGMFALGEGTVRMEPILRDHLNALTAMNIMSYGIAAEFTRAAMAGARTEAVVG